MPVEEAVRRMLAVIRARKSYYAFPSNQAWEVRMLKYLPRSITDAMVMAAGTTIAPGVTVEARWMSSTSLSRASAQFTAMRSCGVTPLRR